jgi:hypothetical protein
MGSNSHAGALPPCRQSVNDSDLLRFPTGRCVNFTPRPKIAKSVHHFVLNLLIEKMRGHVHVAPFDKSAGCSPE